MTVMTTIPPVAAVPARRPRVGGRDRLVYLGIAIAAALVVALADDAVTHFLSARSQLGFLVLFLALPLLALLTRPLEVNPGARKHHIERALAGVYSVRNRRSGILWITSAFWLLWVVVVGGTTIVLVATGLYRWSTALANWAVLTTAAVLIWNLFPGRFHLLPGATFTVAVVAPPAVDRAAFVGLVALDTTVEGWATSTADSGDVAVERLHSLAAGGPVPPPPTDPVRLYFTQPRVWSRLTGDRAVPVEFVDATTAARRSRGRVGVLVLLPRALAGTPADAVKFVKQETQRFLTIRKKGKKQKPPELRLPVAVVVEGSNLPADLGAALDKQFAQLRARDVASYAVPFDPAAAAAIMRASGAAAPVAFLLSTTKIKQKEPAKR